MLTGVEVAGLVLAAVPILLTALEHYRQGFESVKIAKNYLQHLRLLRREVKIQLSIFRHTLEHLLGYTVSPRILRSLLREPDGQLWYEPDIQRQLKPFLGDSYEPFCETVIEFREIVVELLEKFGADPDCDKMRPEKRPWEREFDRVKYCLSKDKRDQLKTRMRDCNKIMRDLTMDSIALLSARSERKLQAIDYREIRDNAFGVHEALDNAPWRCRCKTPHNANLRLESRIPSLASRKGLARSNVSDIELKFRVLFQSDSDESKILDDWREADIVPVKSPVVSRSKAIQDNRMSNDEDLAIPSSSIVAYNQGYSKNLSSVARTTSSTTEIDAPPAKKARKSVRWYPNLDASMEEFATQSVDLLYQRQNLQNIANLCALLQEVAEGKGWLGILATQQRQRQFSLLAIKRHLRQQAEKNILRLHDLLTNQISPGPAISPNMSHCWTPSGTDKRYLAVCLASSVLQLYYTPWLGNGWNRREIFFVRDPSRPSRPMIRQAFVSRAYGGKKSIPQPQSQKSLGTIPLVRNKTIFDLGVLLIELWFCKPLQAMQMPEDMKDGLPNILTDFFTAQRLQETLRHEAGLNWANAVRRCIYCEFDQQDTSLENEDYRQAVYQGVVVPLCEDLKYFCGGKVPAEDWISG